MAKIERFNSVTATLSLTDSASTSAKIPFGPAGGGVIIVDSAQGGATTITWHAVFTPEGVPRPLYSDDAAVQTEIEANRAYPIPDACFASPMVVPVLNAGTSTIRVSLKG